MLFILLGGAKFETDMQWALYKRQYCGTWAFSHLGLWAMGTSVKRAYRDVLRITRNGWVDGERDVARSPELAS